MQWAAARPASLLLQQLLKGLREHPPTCKAQSVTQAATAMFSSVFFSTLKARSCRQLACPRCDSANDHEDACASPATTIRQAVLGLEPSTRQRMRERNDRQCGPETVLHAAVSDSHISRSSRQMANNMQARSQSFRSISPLQTLVRCRHRPDGASVCMLCSLRILQDCRCEQFSWNSRNLQGFWMHCRRLHML
jgi:hypothetical protein